MNVQEIAPCCFVCCSFLEIGPGDWKSTPREKYPLHFAYTPAKVPGCRDVGGAGFSEEVENADTLSRPGVEQQFYFFCESAELLSCIMFLQGQKSPVQGIPGQKTPVNGNDPMGMKSAETDSAVVSNLKSDALPVSEAGRGGKGLCQEGNRITHRFAFLPAKKVFDDSFFDGQLFGIVAVLQVTASALAIIFAGRCYSRRMRRDDLLCFAKKIVFFRLFYCYDYHLIWQNMPDEANLSRCKTGETVTSVDYLCYVQMFMFRHFFPCRQGALLMYLPQVSPVQRFACQFCLSLAQPSRFCRILLFSLMVLLLWSMTAAAAVKIEIKVTGVKKALYNNIMARLAINLQKDNEKLQAKAVQMLHRQAEDDIRSALAPFGYYNPVIKSSLKKKGDTFIVKYAVKKGPPIIVKAVNLELTGAGRKNKRLKRGIRRFPVKVGAVLNQALYEQGKKNLVYRAISEGYLDAAFTERALRIDKEKNSGSVFLVLATGPQYLFGQTTSSQQILDDDLLYRYLPYKEGDPYNPARLFELQSILYRTDYFRQVVVQGQTDDSLDYRVPVEIDLTPPKQFNKYSLGLGYATDTGIRAKLDWSNRLFNSRGHKISASFMVGEFEKAVAIRYDIPRDDPRYNKLVNTLSYQDKKWDDTITKLFAASVVHEYSGPRFNISGGLEMRDEVYDVGNTNGDSTLLVPSLRAGVVFADDVLNTKNGLKTGVSFLGAVKGFVSDTSFLQSTVNGKAIITPMKNWRILGRGSLGATLVDSIDELPPSLRFYTGGDNSIRGYSYRSIGTKDSSGAVIGGRYLVVGSIELERDVLANFSLATFWDVGTATDDLSLDFSQGVGGGVRYRLPFGQIKLDVASAITEDGNPIRFHLSVGGDL